LKPTYFLILFQFLLNLSPCFSQGIDSLSQLLTEIKTPQKKVDIWNEISSLQQPIGGKKAAENALNIAKQIGYTEGEADANYYLSTYFYLKDNQDSARAFIERAIVLYDSLDLQYDKAESLVHLGEIHYFDRNYSKAIKYLHEAENIANQIKDKKLLGIVYETKALIFIDGLEAKEIGKSFLLKSNHLLKETDRTDLLGQSYINLATFYIEHNNVDSSLLFIEKGENLLNKLDHPKENISIYQQYRFTALKGTAYTKIGKIDTAKLFIEQSLPFFIENENWYAVAWSYTDLAKIYLKEKNYKAALSYAQKSIGLDFIEFSINKNTELVRDAYKHINQDSFLVYNEKLIALLADNKKFVNINDIQEVIRKEELSQIEQEIINEKNNNRRIIIGVILLALLYGIGLLYFYRKPIIKPTVVPPKATIKPDSMPQIIETEIDKLRQKVTLIERSLLSKEIDLERQRSSLDNTTQHLKELAEKSNSAALKKSIQDLSNQLAYHQNTQNQWTFFSQQFEQIHPNFFQRLREHTPNLSTREMRLCAYGRLGMTNQEIAQIIGIASGSVSKARHRLKKKMNLDKDQDLNRFLAGL